MEGEDDGGNSESSSDLREQLIHASRDGDLSKVSSIYLISERDCDPMSRGGYGSIPLHHACENGSLYIVKYILDGGCEG